MKKIIFALLLIFSFSVPTLSFATSDTKVITTEAVPGGNCKLKEGVWTGVTEALYECTIKDGFGTFLDVTKVLIKYATYITALLGVLMMVGLGIAMMVGEGDAKKKAKEHMMHLVSGLVLLFLIAFILNTIAPWIYTSGS